MKGDLISRSALLDAMRDTEFTTYFPLDEIDSVIDCAPAVDAEPVRHTKCDFCGRGKPIKAYTYLRDCGLQYGVAIEAIYCPNCGAKMIQGGAE